MKLMKDSTATTALLTLSLVVWTSHVAFLAADDQALEVAPGHNLLTESDAGERAVHVGTAVRPITFRDIAGSGYRLEELTERGPVVFAFVSSSCPLAGRYIERLKRLHAEFSPRGVSFFSVHSSAEETEATVGSFAAAANFPFPTVRDPEAFIALRLGATMTPQVFVVDRERVLRYRGAIDDHRYETRVKKRFLASALRAVVRGDKIEPASTQTMGCTLHLPKPGGTGEITYTQHIAAILQAHCQDCHRPGEVAPFALLSYDDAERWSKEIKAYTAARVMPPWKAAPGFGTFRHDRSLAQREIDLIAAWVDGGTPRGEPQHLPPPREFPEGWALGEPDLVIEMAAEYRVAPEGEDDYRHFVIPTQFSEHKFIRAVDVQPGNRKTVHHVIAYVDTSGVARELDAADEGPGYSRFGDVGFEVASVLGGWAPGDRPFVYPPGTGRWLPKGGDVVLQVHYYRTGVWEADRTRMALYFTEEPDPIPVRWGVAINQEFEIPPGAERHEVKARWRVRKPIYALAVYPHMHLLGREMRVTAQLPNQSSRPLVWIKDWDFNWQGDYFFDDLIYLPEGTVVEAVAYYDNSQGNPNNPTTPPRAVGWGEKTTDEMCIAFVSYLDARQYERKQAQRQRQEDDRTSARSSSQ